MGTCISNVRSITSARKDKLLHKHEEANLLKGDFDYLIKASVSKCIRIFLSSTFSGT